MASCSPRATATPTTARMAGAGGSVRIAAAQLSGSGLIDASGGSQTAGQRELRRCTSAAAAAAAASPSRWPISAASIRPPRRAPSPAASTARGRRPTATRRPARVFLKTAVRDLRHPAGRRRYRRRHRPTGPASPPCRRSAAAPWPRSSASGSDAWLAAGAALPGSLAGRVGRAQRRGEPAARRFPGRRARRRRPPAAGRRRRGGRRHPLPRLLPFRPDRHRGRRRSRPRRALRPGSRRSAAR